jgi:hypothetical protein
LKGVGTWWFNVNVNINVNVNVNVHAQANNLYNNGRLAQVNNGRLLEANNTPIIDQRIAARNIILDIAREHTRKYGNSCKFGKNCKFMCKFKHCKRENCVYHHFSYD